MLSLTQAEQKAEVQKPEVTKLEVLDLDETEVKSDSEQADVQRKRDSGYSYRRPNHVPSSNPRLRLQANQFRGQVASKIPSRLNRPFTRYGPPNHSASGTATHGHTHAQQYRNKLQLHIGQQQSTGLADTGLVQQEVPSPIRNIDFAQANPIASQNNEPFGMHTANYLPPQNQKLPAYSTVDSFSPQTYAAPSPPGNGANPQSQNLLAHTQHHQISDAALFLSENAQAIQQLYGEPASSQDFAPGYNQFQNNGDQIQNPNGRFQDFESTSQSPEHFRTALPPYASGTFDPRETLEQIQSLEKDRLIVQLQQALAQAQTTPSSEMAGRYAQNQASFVQNQELLSAISQQMKSYVSTTPQTVAFAGRNAAFSQSPFLPGTTVAPLGFSLNYGVPTTAQTPTTTTTATTTTGMPATPSQTPLASGGDGTTQVTSSLPAPNQPGTPAGIPTVYGGFVPTFITSANFVPSYSTGVFTSGPVRPVQAAGSSPTHFGLPIPTESPEKPPSFPTTTTSTSVSPTSRPGIPLTPAVTSVALPIRPIAATPLHPIAATPIHPIAAPLHPVLPVNPAQVHPAQTTTPAVTSGNVHPTYGLQTASLINSVLYKPVKAVYPLYYYPNVAYQLQKPVSPSYPWSYAPSYAQTKPAQIWKWGVPVLHIVSRRSATSRPKLFYPLGCADAWEREREISKKKVRRERRVAIVVAWVWCANDAASRRLLTFFA